MFKEIALLAAAGAAGTLCRYGVGGTIQRLLGDGFAWGTLVVNASGCLLFGFFWSLAEERLIITGQTRFIILTGFMGAYTTFSTFAFETAGYLRDSQWWFALANLTSQNVLGIFCVFLGFLCARAI